MSARSLTQTAAAVRPRGRVTERLRDKLATAIAGSNRSIADVAAEHGVSWATAHKALVAAAARWLPEPEPRAVLGIDETRFGSVRWLLDGITWRRSDPWMTSFVDCTPGHPGALLGLAPGRTGGCVRDWLDAQSDAFRRRIEIVVIDPSAPYASGIRAAFPSVKIAIDKWHLVALANTMVTEVRQRVTRSLLGRRGTVWDPIWVNRRLLLTGAKHHLANARHWAVEVKRIAGLEAVEQLTRYVDFLNRDTLLAPVGGIFPSPRSPLRKDSIQMTENEVAEPTPGTAADYMRFLTWAGRTGELPSSTVTNWRIASIKVLEIEGDTWENVNVVDLDLDSHLRRFETLKRTSYASASMKAYKSRAKVGIEAYRGWFARLRLEAQGLGFDQAE